MLKSIFLSGMLCAFGVLAYAQTPVETSATTQDVKINDEKRSVHVLGTRRAKTRVSKPLPADRPSVKHHTPQREAKVFKRHNHNKRKVVSARKRNTRKSTALPQG